MAALTANVLMPTRGTVIRQSLAGGVATTYYQGAALFYLGAGKVTPVAAAGLVFAGFCAEKKTLTSADVTAGVTVEVITDGEILVVYATPARTDEGQFLYVDESAGSDNPADLLPAGHASLSAGNDRAIGRVTAFKSTTEGSWVRLRDVAAQATA